MKGLQAITQRLPEIKKLGANIIWLQPITPPFEEDGHGYDVVEYKKVWSVRSAWRASDFLWSGSRKYSLII